MGYLERLTLGRVVGNGNGVFNEAYGVIEKQSRKAAAIGFGDDPSIDCCAFVDAGKGEGFGVGHGGMAIHANHKNRVVRKGSI